MRNKEEPKVFFSYSHDSKEHKGWVLALATRLEDNGVAVTLDQWDLKLGSNLQQFMSLGLTESDRVILVCTEPYVLKANAMKKGGVAFESMIISSQIMDDLGSNRVIPIVVNNELSPPVPTFVNSKIRLNFDADNYEDSYEVLIHDLHGESITPRPKRGKNPFKREPSEPLDLKKRHGDPNLSGTVTIDPESLEKHFWLGAGNMLFETQWSPGAKGRIRIYAWPSNIRSLRLPPGKPEIREIDNTKDEEFYIVENTKVLDEGRVAILENDNGYFLALKILKVIHSDENNDKSSLTFEYLIAPAKKTSFKLP